MTMKNVGRIIASAFKGQKIDAVMTVATNGVPLANAVADVLNIPFVIVRRDLKITEGSRHLLLHLLKELLWLQLS